MKRLKEGPEAIDTSSNKYQVNNNNVEDNSFRWHWSLDAKPNRISADMNSYGFNKTGPTPTYSSFMFVFSKNYIVNRNI